MIGRESNATTTWSMSRSAEVESSKVQRSSSEGDVLQGGRSREPMSFDA